MYTASDGGWLPLGAKPSSTVTMEDLFHFRNEQSSPGGGMLPTRMLIKYSASSSSLLTMQTIR